MTFLNRHRLLLAVARKSFWHSRPANLANFARYRLSYRRLRARGPDRLRYTPPDVLVWVTTRCNRSCDFCQFRGELNVPGEQDLSLDRFETFLRHRLVRNALRVGLFGGEPLLNADAFKMVRAGHQRGHLVTINTNGVLLGERADELHQHAPDMLTVSYYPENRDVVTNGLAQVASRVPTYLHHVYCRDKLDAIWEAAEVAVECGVMALGFENLYPTNMTSESPVDAGDATLAQIRREVHARYGHRLHIKWLESRAEPVTPGTEPTVCRMFWSRLVIDVEGRWSPCCVWSRDSYAGNLLDEDDAWNGDRLLTARAAMRSNRAPAPCMGCDWLYDELMAL